MAESFLISLEHVGVTSEQFDTPDQQIIEIHGTGAVQPGLVLGEHIGDATLDDGLGRLGVLEYADAAVLGR